MEQILAQGAIAGGRSRSRHQERMVVRVNGGCQIRITSRTRTKICPITMKKKRIVSFVGRIDRVPAADCVAQI
jgi:hypothetical protein